MRILFIHPNFPAQFRHLAEFFGRDKTNQVCFVTANPRPEWEIPGVRKLIYQERKTDLALPPALETYNAVYDRGRAVADALGKLARKKWVPDLIIGASGWGATLFVKDVFPKTPFLGYFEWYYDIRMPNAGFGRKTPPGMGMRMEHRERSLPVLSDLTACDHGICPTHWQKAQFPKEFRHKLSVIHDGINPELFKPDPTPGLKLPGLDLSGAKEIITYTARGFEPYRGFPQFISAIPSILKKRPDAHVVIVGEDRICYGPKLPEGQTYKKIMTEKIKLDPDRVHFVDPLPYGQYRKVLQASSIHVYLTVPFVLSWSLLEAMSCGCLVAASDTHPVREVIQDGVNGVLFDFFNPEKLAQRVTACLEYPSFMKGIREKARQTILDRYALDKMLGAQAGLIRQMLNPEKKEAPRFG